MIVVDPMVIPKFDQGTLGSSRDPGEQVALLALAKPNRAGNRESNRESIVG